MAMRTISRLFVAVAAAFLFSSCGDTSEKLTVEQISVFEDTATVFNQLATGDLTAEESSEKLKKLSEKAANLNERMAALEKDLSEEELRELMEEHGQDLREATIKMSTAVQKVLLSGKMTPELMGEMHSLKK